MEQNRIFNCVSKSGNIVKIDFDKVSTEEANNISSFSGSLYDELFINGNCYEWGPCFIDRGDVVVDLGANIGMFSRAAAESGASKIYSFEIEPSNFECLKINAPPNCVGFNLGISDKDGEYTLYLDKTPGGHSLYDGDINKTKLGTSVKVQCVSLPTLFYQELFKYIDFLKIDIEGTEREVLRSIPDEYLNKIGKISIEYHHMLHDFDKSLDEIIKRMSKFYNYQIIETNNKHISFIFLWKPEFTSKVKENEDEFEIKIYRNEEIKVTVRGGYPKRTYRVEFWDEKEKRLIYKHDTKTGQWSSSGKTDIDKLRIRIYRNKRTE